MISLSDGSRGPSSPNARFARRNAAGDAQPRKEAATRQLSFRCDDVSRQLGRCGLGARRLGDVELAQLMANSSDGDRSDTLTAAEKKSFASSYPLAVGQWKRD